MELSSKYDPSGIEDQWYQQWLNHKLFHSEPNEKEAYTIVIPPPNVTGILHMGHMLNNTIQDILIRRARMRGYNACWVPGTDHASIATEAKVVDLLKQEGKSKHEVGREKFLEHAFEWKDKYGGIILKQLQKLGCSCDWERTRFTMEPKLSDAVIGSFIDLYEQGYIYRGTRMVNWDPIGKTALSDEEVNHKEQQAKLYYIAYQVEESDETITIATTRPETLLGDTAVCVHPDDKRFSHLVGKNCIVPLVNRSVPIIADEYVDIEFGTGALKITPAHDVNDYELGQKHKLELIDIFDPDAKINKNAGLYIGVDRFEARKMAVSELENSGQLTKVEEIQNKIGLSERTHAPIEPKLSTQWFVNMKKFMKDYPEVLDDVMNDTIQLYPAKFKNTYRHWLENIKDWCISRQLWWGQRIPAWYTPEGEIVIAQNADEALTKARKQNPNITANDLKQDEDVLDTWFSSWLWPISVFDGFTEEGQKELDYYYPTADLVTAPDIIFFWVARMVMAGYHYKKEKPFNRVYFTGIVRDKQRRKMSKSLGNSPDPIKLMEDYGTDGVRMGLMLSAPAGNDLLFDEASCEQGRNFCNKLWNSFRLIQGWETSTEQNEYYSSYGPAIHNWMSYKISDAIVNIDRYFDEFRISDALMELYKLTRDDFSSWYLEMLKPKFGEPIPQQDLQKIKSNFDLLLRLLHPYMPFITEHLWQNLEDRKNSFINQKDWPQQEAGLTKGIENAVFQLISEIRAKRNEHQISPKVAVQVQLSTPNQEFYKNAEGILEKLANVSKLSFSGAEGFKTLIGTDEAYLEFEDFEEKLDVDKINKEIKRLEGFLFGIEKKLQNEKFMQNANEAVIDKEKQKQADTEAKLNSLKAQLS
ncbi:MAG: valine--tRNA ligase [Bacteroidia bacterium]